METNLLRSSEQGKKVVHKLFDISDDNQKWVSCIWIDKIIL